MAALAKYPSGTTVSKSSSSTKQLPIGKKKFNQSLLLFGSTAKDRNSTANIEKVTGTDDQNEPDRLKDSKKMTSLQRAQKATSRKKEHIETVSDLNRNSFSRLT